jgi:hypothetical protein
LTVLKRIFLGAAMKVSDQKIEQLQLILKGKYGLDYDNQKAKEAGRAILRLAGIKLYQTYEKEFNNEPHN